MENEYGHTETADGDGGPFDDFLGVIEMASMFNDPKDFIAYVDKLIAAAEAASKDDWSGRVVISTIHKLKGLERPCVFAVGMSEYSEMQETGVTSLLPHTFTFVSPPNQGKLPSGGRNRLEDERCLYFVLLTRAMEKAYVFSPYEFRKQPMQPSRFIHETHKVLGFVEEEEEEEDTNMLSIGDPNGNR